MPKKRNKQQKRQMMAFMICLFFFISTAVGALFANSLSKEEVLVLSEGITLLSEEKSTFLSVFLKYLKYDVLIWLGGCFCYGGILSAGVFAFRGVSLGYTTAILLRSYETKGIFISICALLPQNMILLPVYFFMTWLCLCFLLEQNNAGAGKGALKRETQKRWTEYIILLFASFLGVGIASFLELYVANMLTALFFK